MAKKKEQPLKKGCQGCLGLIVIGAIIVVARQSGCVGGKDGGPRASFTVPGPNQQLISFKFLKDKLRGDEKHEIALLVSPSASKEDVMKLAEWLRQANESRLATLDVLDSEELWRHMEDPSYPKQEWEQHWLAGLDDSTNGRVVWLADKRRDPKKQ